NLLVRDRLCDRGQRHQGRLGLHRAAFSVCTRTKVAGSRSNGSVPAMTAKASNTGPMELAIRVATSGSTTTPAISAVALASLAVGLVMLQSPSLPGCGLNQVSPCSRRLDGPFGRAPQAWGPRRHTGAPRTGSGCESGI